MQNFEVTDIDKYADKLFNSNLMASVREIDNVKKFEDYGNAGYNFLMPYVGQLYNETGILLVTESKYINDENDFEEGKKFFLWMLDKITNNSTEKPNEEYINNHKHQIYSLEPFTQFYKRLTTKENNHKWPFLKLMSEIERIYGYTKENSIKSFAFMNFFSIPVICKNNTNKGYNKTVFNKLISCKYKTRKERNDLWEKYVSFCSETLDNVIKIIKPKLILLASNISYNSYCGKYKDDNRVIHLYHPSGRSWYNKMSENNLSSKELCREKIEALYSTNHK